MFFSSYQTVFVIFLSTLLCISSSEIQQQSNVITIKSNPAVKELDVTAYLGLWYQMYANKFVLETIQRHAFCATATYADNGDGTISVYNYQTDRSPTGKVSDISGYAYMPDKSKPGQLRVHLGDVPFDGSYWILDLGVIKNGKYEWVIVSDRISLNLFVLARDPVVFRLVYDRQVNQKIKDMGFDPIGIYQEKDCKYGSVTRAEEIQEQMLLVEVEKSLNNNEEVEKSSSGGDDERRNINDNDEWQE